MARILIADDDGQFGSMFAGLLTDRGHEVRECTDGEYIEAILAEGGFELVLLDMIMEKKGGLETLVGLRRDHPELPVVVVSGADGGPGEDIFQAAAYWGAAGCLRKPFSPEEIFSVIDRVLGC